MNSCRPEQRINELTMEPQPQGETRFHLTMDQDQLSKWYLPSPRRKRNSEQCESYLIQDPQQHFWTKALSSNTKSQQSKEIPLSKFEISAMKWFPELENYSRFLSCCSTRNILRQNHSKLHPWIATATLSSHTGGWPNISHATCGQNGVISHLPPHAAQKNAPRPRPVHSL
jgi:hypothetical protein